MLLLTATWPVCSQAVVLRPESFATKCRQATSASTLAWPHQWPSSHSLAGRKVSSATCLLRDAMLSNSTLKRRLSLSAGPKNGRASSEERLSISEHCSEMENLSSELA